MTPEEAHMIGELKDRLKNGPKDACLLLDGKVWWEKCGHFREPNCRLADRTNCPLLSERVREELRNEK